MTNLLLLIGAGLFSKATSSFEKNAFNHIVGSNLDDTSGTGPGSYRVQGNVWHLDCCSPASGQKWSIFSAIFGWSNDASSNVTYFDFSFCPITYPPFLVGTVLSYIFYWLAVMGVLLYMKFKEVRPAIFPH